MNKTLPVSTLPIRIYLPSKPLFARLYILLRTRSLLLSISTDTVGICSPLKKLFARPDIELGPAPNMQAVSVITHSVESCSPSKTSFARLYSDLEFRLETYTLSLSALTQMNFLHLVWHCQLGLVCICYFCQLSPSRYLLTFVDTTG